MKIQTNVQTEGIWPNHNQTLVQSVPGKSLNHNQALVQPVPSQRLNHNQTLVRKAS